MRGTIWITLHQFNHQNGTCRPVQRRQPVLDVHHLRGDPAPPLDLGAPQGGRPPNPSLPQAVLDLGPIEKLSSNTAGNRGRRSETIIYSSLLPKTEERLNGTLGLRMDDFTM